MISQPLDPAHEVRGDSLERSDVDRPVQVKVGPRLWRGERWLEDEVVRGVAHAGEGADLADQGLQGATCKWVH